MADRSITAADRAIADNVQTLRFESYKTQAQVAEFIMTSPQQYSKYELGKSRIPNVILWRLAKLFDKDISTFFAGVDDAYV